MKSLVLPILVFLLMACASSDNWSSSKKISKKQVHLYGKDMSVYGRTVHVRVRVENSSKKRLMIYPQDFRCMRDGKEAPVKTFVRRLGDPDRELHGKGSAGGDDLIFVKKEKRNLHNLTNLLPGDVKEYEMTCEFPEGLKRTGKFKIRRVYETKTKKVVVENIVWDGSR